MVGGDLVVERPQHLSDRLLLRDLGQVNRQTRLTEVYISRHVALCRSNVQKCRLTWASLQRVGGTAGQ